MGGGHARWTVLAALVAAGAVASASCAVLEPPPPREAPAYAPLPEEPPWPVEDDGASAAASSATLAAMHAPPARRRAAAAAATRATSRADAARGAPARRRLTRGALQYLEPVVPDAPAARERGTLLAGDGRGPRMADACAAAKRAVFEALTVMCHRDGGVVDHHDAAATTCDCASPRVVGAESRCRTFARATCSTEPADAVELGVAAADRRGDAADAARRDLHDRCLGRGGVAADAEPTCRCDGEGCVCVVGAACGR